MNGQPKQADLGEELTHLETLTLGELRQVWAARLNRPPPRLRSRDLLVRALAYQLQIRALGDLSAPLRRKAIELARRFENEPGFSPTPGPVLKPGSSLIREWRGVRHEVRVMEDGFSYQGESLRSLSEAAHRITGTKWNGLVFFGLKERRPSGAPA